MYCKGETTVELRLLALDPYFQGPGNLREVPPRHEVDLKRPILTASNLSYGPVL